MVALGHAGTTLFLDYKLTRNTAAGKLIDARKELVGSDTSRGEFSKVLDINLSLGKRLLAEPNVINAFVAKDRGALQAALKPFFDQTGFPGTLTFLDANRKIVLSTEAPNKAGTQMTNAVIETVFSQGKEFPGVVKTETGGFVLESAIPLVQGGRVAGCLCLNQALNIEYLTGVAAQIGIKNAQLNGVDLALLANDDGKLVAYTTGLVGKSGGPFVAELESKGKNAIPAPTTLPIPSDLSCFFPTKQGGFERGQRWWIQLPLGTVGTKEEPAILLFSTKVPDMTQRMMNVGLLAGGVCLVGLLMAFWFVASLSKEVNAPLRFLIRRTNELASQKQSIPALEGLDGDWLELGELIDTAVSSMRHSTQSLRKELNKQQEAFKEKAAEIETTNQQLDQLNRQFSQQAKQLSEASKQINYSNRQAVMLQHKLESVMQVSTEGFLVLDHYGNVMSANPVFLNWVGSSEGEIAGRLCFDLVKKVGEPRNSEGTGQAFAKHGDPNALINNFYPEGVIYHRTKDSKIDVLAHLQPITGEDNKIEGYIMVLRDKSLRSENAQLKQEIVAMLQDSIRTQLVAGETRWMPILNNANQTMHPSVGQALAELHTHYEQLIGLVDSLLMIYGGFVPPPVIPKEQVVITRLVADCLEEVSPLARGRQLLLDYKTVTGLPPINCNKEQLHSILIQVLHRMIGVTAPGGRVRVESQIRNQEMRIGVTSSGPALAANEITDMFAGFIQGKHSEDTYSDRLAMYLARNNVERLGGRIWAESEAGRGTAVFFTLSVS